MKEIHLNTPAERNSIINEMLNVKALKRSTEDKMVNEMENSCM